MTSTIIKTKQAQKGMDAILALHDRLCDAGEVATRIRHGLSDVIVVLIDAGFPPPNPPRNANPASGKLKAKPKAKGPDTGDPLAGGLAS